MINIYSHENVFYPVILSFILFLLHCLSALVIPILDQDHTKVLAVLLVREKKNQMLQIQPLLCGKADCWELI